jgi:peptide/nickel transport system ATP-binding protein/oligopeptide transport system ATP-binding protein
MRNILLKVDDLKVSFQTMQGLVTAVDGVGFTVARGANLGIVGESGCGKSVTALSLMGLISSPPGNVAAATLNFDGRDLQQLTAEEYRKIRGKEMGMVFQEPMTSLNPVFTIGNQVAEAVLTHMKISRRQAREMTVAMLDRVGISEPEKRIHDYPHQLSGGLRQRVVIAMALICKPKLLIADEPTTALDVTIQAQVLDLMQELREDLGMSMIMITHDLGVVAEVAEQVVIMYAGMVVESATVNAIFQQPLHPYTQGLLHSIPRLDRDVSRLDAIPGMVPDMLHVPPGCRFANRCRRAIDICHCQCPASVEPEAGHQVSCWLYA